MSTSVVAITQSWELNESLNSMSGTKVFIEAASLPSKPTTTLPTLGEVWDSSNTYSQLIATNIQTKYVGDNDNCGMVYTVTYAYNPINEAVVVDELDLPSSLSINAEINSYVPNKTDKNCWRWSTDGARITDQAIGRREVTASITLQKYVRKNSMDEYLAIIAPHINHLNNATFYNIPMGLLMFLGADMTEVPQDNGTSQRKWLVQLKFGLKSNYYNGSFVADYGWNRAYRPENNNFDYPLYNGHAGNVMYLYSDFEQLI